MKGISSNILCGLAQFTTWWTKSKARRGLTETVMEYLPIFVEINTRCDNDGSGFLERGEFREVCGGLGIAKVFPLSHFTLEESLTYAVHRWTWHCQGFSSSHFTLEKSLTYAVEMALPTLFHSLRSDGAVLTDSLSSDDNVQKSSDQVLKFRSVKVIRFLAE